MDNNVDVDMSDAPGAVRRKLRRKQSDPFLPRTSSLRQSHHSQNAVYQAHIINQNFTRPTGKHERRASVTRTLSTENLADLAKAHGQNKQKFKVEKKAPVTKQHVYPGNEARMPTHMKRSARSREQRIRNAVNIIKDEGLADADDETKEYFAHAESHNNKNLNAGTNVKNPGLQTVLGPKTQPAFDVHQDDDLQSQQQIGDHDLDTVIASMSSSGVDAATGYHLNLHITFKQTGRQGYCLGGIVVNLRDISDRIALNHYLMAYDPYRLHVKRQGPPTRVTFIAGQHTHFLDLPNDDEFERHYTAFTCRAQELGQEEAKKVAKHTELRRKVSKAKLRERFDVDGTERMKEDYEVRERKADLIVRMILLW